MRFIKKLGTLIFFFIDIYCSFNLILDTYIKSCLAWGIDYRGQEFVENSKNNEIIKYVTIFIMVPMSANECEVCDWL